MRPPEGRAGESGYTLMELLIVIALWGVISILVMVTLTRWINTNSEEVARLEEDRRMIEALDRFSRDVREARAILEVTPERTLLWQDDLDTDGIPGVNEIVEYGWSADQEWTRTAPDGSNRFPRIAVLEIGADSTPPATRHLVVYLTFGDPPHSLGTSAALRANPPGLEPSR